MFGSGDSYLKLSAWLEFDKHGQDESVFHPGRQHGFRNLESHSLFQPQFPHPFPALWWSKTDGFSDTVSLAPSLGQPLSPISSFRLLLIFLHVFLPSDFVVFPKSISTLCQNPYPPLLVSGCEERKRGIPGIRKVGRRGTQSQTLTRQLLQLVWASEYFLAHLGVLWDPEVPSSLNKCPSSKCRQCKHSTVWCDPSTGTRRWVIPLSLVPKRHRGSPSPGSALS